MKVWLQVSLIKKRWQTDFLCLFISSVENTYFQSILEVGMFSVWCRKTPANSLFAGVKPICYVVLFNFFEYAINIYLQVFHIRNRYECNVHAFYEFPIKTKASENLKLNKVDLRKYLYYYYNIHKNRSHNGMQ